LRARSVAEHPAAVRLFRCVSTEQDKEALARRALQLVGEETDPNYQHPYDIALAVYLRILDIVAPAAALDVASASLRVANLWWALPIAKRVLAGATALGGEVGDVGHAGAMPHRALSTTSSPTLTIYPVSSLPLRFARVEVAHGADSIQISSRRQVGRVVTDAARDSATT
jgi:hypothetical protein